MNNNLKEYFDALNRLKNNTPINVPKNSKINNDTVSLEAGRKRGSIKKNREIFYELIESINSISEVRNTKTNYSETKITKLKSSIKEYKTLYEETINRELMHIEKINQLEKLINKKNHLSVNNHIYGQDT